MSLAIASRNAGGMARTPEGEGDWAWAEKQAVNHTILVPNKGRHYRLAYSLGHYWSQLRQPSPLPVEKVAKFLGMSLGAGATTVKGLVREGRLKTFSEHNHGKKKAREYTFVPDPTAAA
jgi:hypothetical protein